LVDYPSTLKNKRGLSKGNGGMHRLVFLLYLSPRGYNELEKFPAQEKQYTTIMTKTLSITIKENNYQDLKKLIGSCPKLASLLIKQSKKS